MKILSLFDGIACARVALERAGISVEKYYASEIDKYTVKIAQKNYPDIIQVGDVTKIKREYNFWGKPILRYGLNDIIEGIDLIIGGFPCQDLSIAKKDREGLKGKRSGLFWYMVDIVRFIRPKYFIFENVASMPKKDKAIITETLWGIEPVMIDAALVSAQRRRRLFWVGRLEGDRYVKVDVPLPKDRGIALKDIIHEARGESFDVERYILSDKKIKYILSRPKSYECKINPDKTNTLRTNYGNASANETYVSIRVGQINKGGQGDRIYSIEGKSVCLSANGGGRGAKTGLYLVKPVALRNRGEGKKPEYNGIDKANCLTTVQTDSMVDINSYIRKLTPIECERLQGLPDNYTEGISNTQRYRCLGNAFNVDVVAHIIRGLR